MRKVTCGIICLEKHQIQNTGTIIVESTVPRKGWYSPSHLSSHNDFMSFLYSSFLKYTLNAESYDIPLCFPPANDQLWSFCLFNVGKGIRVRTGSFKVFRKYGIMVILTGCLISMCSIFSNPVCFSIL